MPDTSTFIHAPLHGAATWWM